MTPEEVCDIINRVKEVTGGTYTVEPMGRFNVNIIEESGGVMCMLNILNVDMSFSQNDPKKRPKFVKGSGIRIERGGELYGGPKLTDKEWRILNYKTKVQWGFLSHAGFGLDSI